MAFSTFSNNYDDPNDEDDSSTEETIIVKKIKDPNKHKYSPPIDIPIQVLIRGKDMQFTLPFDDYPISCELEKGTFHDGYWTEVFYDSETCVISFDGSKGSYKLSLYSGDSQYIGYFIYQ